MKSDPSIILLSGFAICFLFDDWAKVIALYVLTILGFFLITFCDKMIELYSDQDYSTYDTLADRQLKASMDKIKEVYNAVDTQESFFRRYSAACLEFWFYFLIVVYIRSSAEYTVTPSSTDVTADNNQRRFDNSFLKHRKFWVPIFFLTLPYSFSFVVEIVL